jgi:hypothetical protein
MSAVMFWGEEIRRVLPRPGERDTTWELAFDLSSVPKGRTEDIEIEATVGVGPAPAGRGSPRPYGFKQERA